MRPGRPDDATWSALEYACHVRDVYRRYTARVGLMLAQDDPLFPNWDQDTSAVVDRYEQQDPDAVVEELEAAAGDLAGQLAPQSPVEWDRPGRRSDGASFTVATLVRYMIHDPVHHVWDVEVQRRRTAAAPADPSVGQVGNEVVITSGAGGLVDPADGDPGGVRRPAPEPG